VTDESQEKDLSPSMKLNALLNMDKIHKVVGLAMMAGIALSPSSSLHADEAKIGPRLKAVLSAFEGDTEESVPAIVSEIGIPVIVHFSGRPDLKRIEEEEPDEDSRHERVVRELRRESELSQRALTPLLSWFGVSEVRNLWLINGLAAKLPPWLIEYLADEEKVSQITLDYAITHTGTGPGTQGPVEWNLTVIGAPALWNLGYTGQGVVVANMDTGVDMNDPAIVAAWRGGINSWFDPNCPAQPGSSATCQAGVDYSQPRDSDGHGSGTMSIMVGGIDNTGSAIGVAPGAKWIAVKMFDDAGMASVSGVHAGFQWLLDPDGDPTTNDAPDIINNSWDLQNAVDQCVLTYQADIQALNAAGIAVVFSAGNVAAGGNAHTSVSPANNPGSYAVGALDQFDNLASFSSRGPGPAGTPCGDGFFPELVAPGVNVRMLTKSAIPGLPKYVSASGTSFSAPHVAGAMALLISADPNLTVAQLEAILAQSARDQVNPSDPAGPDVSFGYGALDVAAAYQWLVTDTDGDGLMDAYDNCVTAANADQRDSNGDGFGNWCDADLNNDGIVNGVDFGIFSQVFFTRDPDADLNGDGTVNGVDFGRFSELFFGTPGPSAWALP